MKRLILILFLIIPSMSFSQRYLWQKSFGSVKRDVSINMIRTEDKGFLIFAKSYGGDKDSFLLIKLDSIYTHRWTRYYPLDPGYGMQDIVEEKGGNFLLAGLYKVVVDSINTYMYPSILSVDSNGDTLWSKKYYQWRWPDISAYFTKVIQLSDNNFLLRMYSGPRPLLKIDNNGDTLWSKVLGPINLYAIQDSFIAIHSSYFKKFTNDGNLVYDKQLNLPISISGIYPVRGGYTLLGGYRTPGNNQKDIMAMALVNYNGDTIWTGKYDGGGNAYARDIKQTADSGFLILGHGNSIGGNDLILIKVDKYGKLQWGKVLQRPGNNETATKLELNCDSSIIVIGNASNGQIGGDDIILLKIDSLPNVFGPCGFQNEIPINAPGELTVKVFPNPTTDAVHIKLNKELDGNIYLYNIIGQQLRQYQLRNMVNYSIHLTSINPGIYILSIYDQVTNKTYNYKIAKY